MLKNCFAVALFCLSLCVFGQQPIDCIFYNAHIYSFESMRETAQAMAVHQGKIVAIGSNEAVQTQYKALQIINLKQQHVYPSWTDAHGHFIGLGMVAVQPNLRSASSMQELVNICLKAQSQYQLKYIKAWGWNQERFTNKSLPDNHLLNQYFPNIPVFLKRVDGHAALVNQAALKLAGIADTSTRFGNFMHKFNGKATGLLFDAAADSVEKYLNRVDLQTQIAALLQAQSICFDEGIAMVHDAGIDLATLQLIDSLQEKGILQIRINAMLYLTDTAFSFLHSNGPIHKNQLVVNGFKMVVDGALGSRGACLKQPYSDQTNSYGTFLQSPNQFANWIQKVAASPFQLSTHAIGDSANSFVLKQYALHLQHAHNRRWRIEHAQVLDSSLYAYFDGSNILPSVQPIHAYSDHTWAIKRLGKQRMQHAYAYNTLLQQAGKLVLGTDFPVESPNPLQNYWAALGMYASKKSIASNQFITAQQAFKGMTYWPAYAAFLENDMGNLAIGKWADFTVYNQNLLQLKANQIKEAKPQQLYISGKQVK